MKANNEASNSQAKSLKTVNENLISYNAKLVTLENNIKAVNEDLEDINKYLN